MITVLDGAHMDGQVPVNLNELGCDYFAGSPHKWLFAPPGCGLLLRTTMPWIVLAVCGVIGLG